MAPPIASPRAFIAVSSGVIAPLGPCGRKAPSKPGWRSHQPVSVKVWLVMKTVGWTPELNWWTASDSGSEKGPVPR